jgi:hypothetical protein
MEDDEDLATWVRTQQNRVINSNKVKPISPLEKKLLGTLPGWEKQVPEVDDQWLVQFNKLKGILTLKNRHPDPLVEEEKELYKWCER